MDSYNYSALATAYKCNQLFKYLYVDKLKEPTEPSGDLAYGTAMHLALESMLSGSPSYLRDFQIFWKQESTINSKFGRYNHEELREQAKILLARFERLHLKKFKAHQLETRLYGEYQGIKLEGTPDVLGEYEGIPSVVDFKTSGFRYPKESLRRAEQLLLYAFLSNQSGYKVSQLVYVVFIKGNTPSIQTLTRYITDKDVEDTLDNIKLQIEHLDRAQKTGQYSRNYANCIKGEFKCPFFSRCHKETE